MKEENRKGATYRIHLAAYIISLVSFAFSAIYAPRLLALLGHRDPDEYKLVILQSVLAAIALHLPPFSERLLRFRLPRGLSLLYTLFLWSSVFLGEALGFYYRFAHWDDLLHLVSGGMLCCLGFLVSERTSGGASLPPLFRAAFAFFFALSFGTLWEVYEYICDGALGINMQKFADGSAISEGLIPLVGREALKDTMEDLTVDTLGALSSATAGFLLCRRNTFFEVLRYFALNGL